MKLAQSKRATISAFFILVALSQLNKAVPVKMF